MDCFDDDKPHCDLAVIDAGMPRTGSTLLYELAADACTYVKKGAKHLRCVNAGYWRLDRHLNQAPGAWTLQRIPNGTNVVPVKSHEWEQLGASYGALQTKPCFNDP